MIHVTCVSTFAFQTPPSLTHIQLHFAHSENRKNSLYEIMEPQRVDADLLVPGRGEPIRNASVVFTTRILWAGSRVNLPSEYSSLKATSYPVILPGLWDAHVHYFGTDVASLDALMSLPQSLAGVRLASDLAATLNAGFTSVRELGGFGIDLAKAVDEGSVPGPKIYSSATILSQTAGHGDLHSHDLHSVKDGMSHGLPVYVCDGVDECLKAVRMQIRRGAKVIKVCATGGGSSIIDDVQQPQFSHPELCAIVEEAARSDRIVAAHCHGKRGIIAALKAGCKTIEHCSCLDDECIQLIREKDAMVISTRYTIDYALQHAQDFSKEAAAKLQIIGQANEDSCALAIKSGLRMALGTDVGVITGPKFNQPHGTNAEEFVYAVRAGMTPLEAIEAGTANAPASLGPQAPRSGQLREGYDADLIALSRNPLEDIHVLTDTGNISHVWKGGKLFKGVDQVTDSRVPQ